MQLRCDSGSSNHSIGQRFLEEVNEQLLIYFITAWVLEWLYVPRLEIPFTEISYFVISQKKSLCNISTKAWGEKGM